MFTNHSSREINLRLVYVGPEGSGKAESLRAIYERTDPEARGRLISAASDTERTIFFDFAPKGLGEIRGYRVRIHLYCLEGPEPHPASTRLLLRNADGVVFVVDARPERLEADREALRLLQAAIGEQGRAYEALPRAFQVCHLRSPEASSPEELQRALGIDAALIPADPSDGSGVFDALKAGVRALLLGMKDGRVTEWELATRRESEAIE